MGNMFTRDDFWRGEIRNKKFHRVRMKLIKEENERYQSGYPDQVDNPDLNENYLFHTNQIPSRPDGALIDVIHQEWAGDYVKLEKHHGYIQWLFPTRERGQNIESQMLQKHEIEEIMADDAAMARYMKSFEMMLDFFGTKLVNVKRGTVVRADNWEERSACLVGTDYRTIHNYLRVTRILRSLGEFNLEHFKHGIVDFFFEEVIINRTLPLAIESLYDYWIPSLREYSSRDVFYQRFNMMVKFYPETYNKEGKEAAGRDRTYKASSILCNIDHNARWKVDEIK